MKAVKIFAFLIILAMATVCYATGKGLTNTDFSILYVSANKVIEIGEHDAWNLKDAKLYYDEDRLVGLTVYSDDYLTSRGLRIGDSVDKVRQYYGEPHKSGERNAFKWITYYYENGSSSLKMHFCLDKTQETIVAIHVDLYPVSIPPLIRLDPEYEGDAPYIQRRATN